MKAIGINIIIGLGLLSLIMGILDWNTSIVRSSGMILSGGSLVVFFISLFVLRRARTKANPMVVGMLIFAGLGIHLVDLAHFSLFLFVVHLLTVVSWLLYVHWYSVFGVRDQSVIDVGKNLPNIEMKDQNGEKYDNSNLAGNPALFMFYRGNWCPLCMAQIREIADQYKAIAERGAKIFLISPQPERQTASLAEKFDVPFKFIHDADNRLAKQFKLLDKNGLPMGFQVLGYDSDVPMPTVFITDKDNKIVFADLTDNYRVRPEPETFIQVLNAL